MSEFNEEALVPFMKMLQGLSQSTQNKTQMIQCFSIVERYLANDSRLYSSIMKDERNALGDAGTKSSKQSVANLQSMHSELSQKMNIENMIIDNLVKVEMASPYSLLKFVFDMGAPDVRISYNKIEIQYSNEYQKVEIPNEYLEVYQNMVMHAINCITFTAGTKFDVSNAVVDANLEGIRFNIVHAALNSIVRFPIITARQQIINSMRMGDSYLNSVTSSDKHREVIRNMAKSGTFMIFGTTGSGKTTLLKYIAREKASNEPNLITIEDTAEIFAPVTMALVRNNDNSIHDLFIASLRQNPSSVFVGESRDDTVVDILEAALTTNCASTLHATSLQKAFERILFMSMPRHIEIDAVRALILAAVDVFVYMDAYQVSKVYIRKPHAVYRPGEPLVNLYEEV